MKQFLSLLTVLLFLLSCEKTKWDNPTVDQFVTMLLKGNYDSPYLPDFKPRDIDRLLYYANDFQKIEEFPINSISSFRPAQLRLGECLLWTVESVRLNYDKTSAFEKYPSLVPQLIIPGGTIEPQIASLADLNRAFNLYSSWWTNNKSQDFENFRSINPLRNSGLMWR